jgi:hypothetical protein
MSDNNKQAPKETANPANPLNPEEQQVSSESNVSTKSSVSTVDDELDYDEGEWEELKQSDYPKEALSDPQEVLAGETDSMAVRKEERRREDEMLEHFMRRMTSEPLLRAQLLEHLLPPNQEAGPSRMNENNPKKTTPPIHERVPSAMTFEWNDPFDKENPKHRVIEPMTRILEGSQLDKMDSKKQSHYAGQGKISEP